jgi:hypothetical protein
VKLRPFLGVMGMPPDQPGIHSTIPPRATGGNLDCRELVSGSTAPRRHRARSAGCRADASEPVRPTQWTRAPGRGSVTPGDPGGG